MKRKLTTAALIIAAVLHLTIALLSSAKIPAWDYMGKGTAGTLTVVYAYLSGVGNHYGFFAPGVKSQFRVDYVALRDGVAIATGDVQTRNSETKFRWHNAVENFWLSQDKESLRRSQAASLAGKVLAQHPQAQSVRLTVKAFVLPSLSEYAEGQRPSWEEHYAVTFRRQEVM
jgi:hypothetical protein